MSDLEVTRLLVNPMGHRAPPGARGDIVAVTDGTATVYLTPDEFDVAGQDHPRWLLAAKHHETTTGRRARH